MVGGTKGIDMNKKIAEELRNRKIYNEYEIVTYGNPSVYVRIPDTRDVAPRAFVVTVKGKPFKNQSWYQYGSLWFSFYGKEQKAKAKKDAFDWIEKNFPGMEMVVSPFSNSAWIPEDDLQNARRREIVNG